jgi:hypothetical protein
VVSPLHLQRLQWQPNKSFKVGMANVGASLQGLLHLRKPVGYMSLPWDTMNLDVQLVLLIGSCIFIPIPKGLK